MILWDIVVSPFRRLERESGLPHLSAPDRRLEDTGVQRFERLIVSDRIYLSNQASSRLSLNTPRFFLHTISREVGVNSSDTNVLSFVSDFSHYSISTRAISRGLSPCQDGVPAPCQILKMAHTGLWSDAPAPGSIPASTTSISGVQRI